MLCVNYAAIWGAGKMSPIVYESDIINYFENSLQHVPSEHLLCRKQLTRSCPEGRHNWNLGGSRWKTYSGPGQVRVKLV